MFRQLDLLPVPQDAGLRRRHEPRVTVDPANHHTNGRWSLPRVSVVAQKAAGRALADEKAGERMSTGRGAREPGIQHPADLRLVRQQHLPAGQAAQPMALGVATEYLVATHVQAYGAVQASHVFDRDPPGSIASGFGGPQ